MTAAAVEAARAFVHAVAWGEHLRVWDLFGEEGRRAVLRIAVDRGMDEGLAARLRDGTATTTERDAFLSDLVNGLRADLEGADVDELEFAPDPDPDDGRLRVLLLVAPPGPLAADGGLPVGSVELAEEGPGWRVQRLLPRPGRWGL